MAKGASPLTATSPSPVHHVDAFEVDESFADLQAEQHQGYIGQLVLVLSQVDPQLQECQHTGQTGTQLKSLLLTLCHVELGCKISFSSVFLFESLKYTSYCINT